MGRTLKETQAIAERRTTVAELVEQGHTLASIARKLGVSKMTISRDYHAILGELAAERKTYGDAILQDQLQRLERLIDHYEPLYEVDPKAASIYLKALDQRARLLDLYPKQEVQATQTTNNYVLVFDGGAGTHEDEPVGVVDSTARRLADTG